MTALDLIFLAAFALPFLVIWRGRNRVDKEREQVRIAVEKFASSHPDQVEALKTLLKAFIETRTKSL